MQDKKHGIGGWLALGAAGLTLLLVLLAGCGDLSLLEALQEESPGALRLSPSTALVPENTDFTFTVLGGFTPYEVALTAGVTPNPDNTWVFQGKDITGESELFTIEATDLLGNTATAEVTVYYVPSPLELSVSEVTLLVGQSWTFIASGGSGGYTWAVDDLAAVPPPSPDTFPYVAVTPGSHTVTVTDSVGVSQAATVTVEALVPDAPLAITPTSATVEVNGSLSFTAIGGSGPYTFEVVADGDSGNFAVADANPATYLAPGTARTDEIKLTDDAGATVSARVTVISVSTLSLSPQNPILSGIGDTIQFQAKGGTGPGTYTFTSSKPNQGRIDPVTGFYEQLGLKNVTVTVTDGSGAKEDAIVKVK
jgi:hypothetical protein